MEQLNQKTTFTLLNGEFSSDEAIDLLSQLIKVKINFHEGKIKSTDSEENLKYRERKIKSLQNDLMTIREILGEKGKAVHLESEVRIGIN
jgi:hypothetical protein